MTSFKAKSGLIVNFLKSIRCEGFSKKAKKSSLTNQCVIALGGGDITILGTDLTGAVFNMNTLHSGEIIDEGVIPVSVIKEEKTGGTFGLIDLLSIYDKDEEVTVSYDGNHIFLKGERDGFEIETTSVGLIKPYKLGLKFLKGNCSWDKENKCPIYNNKTLWKDSAHIPPKALSKVHKIAEKIGKAAGKVKMNLKMNKDGLYMNCKASDGIVANATSFVSEIVHLQDELSVYEGMYRHGIGNVFNQVDRCYIHLGKGKGDVVHMWIHSDAKDITYNYFITGSNQ